MASRTDHLSRRARLFIDQLEDRVVPATAFALLPNNALAAFSTENPGAANAAVQITGLATGDTLVGIDVRPQNGGLYGLATTATVGSVRLYHISEQTGFATALTAAPVGFTNVVGPTTTPIPITGTAFGFDFNPVVDRIRVTTDTGMNFRINPNTGALADSDNDPTNGIAPDATISGGPTGSTGVDATAYTNSSPNAAATTQYTLDATSNTLSIQGAMNPPGPNGGVQSNTMPVTLNGQTLDFTGVNGFDIPASVTVTTSGTAATGTAFAVLTTTTGGTAGTRLYGIDLATAAATDLGPVTLGATGLAVQSEQPGTGTAGTPLIGFTGTSLTRFNSGAAGATAPTGAVTGLQNGETLVGIDFRPATGQLFGLGINPGTANGTGTGPGTGTLYLIDPQQFTATPVGTVGGIAFTTTAGAAVAFPDPAAVGYGFDFNPTVDRIRVTTTTGLNFRLNPNGTAVDTDATAGNGTNPDGTINAQTGTTVTGLDAVAYTNSFGQVLPAAAGQPAIGTTTLYGLDSATDGLYIQRDPNGGGVTLVGPVTTTTGGTTTTLNFTAVNGFDIPANVRTGASNSAATSGFGFAALTVGGVTSLYRIDLATGAATSLGAVGGAGATALSGLAAADTPVGTVQFSAATFTATENGGTSMAVTLTRTAGSAGAFTVTVGVSGGTATAGTDFGTVPTTVTFADGQTTATVMIPLTDDAVFEGDETIALALSTPTNGAVLGGRTTTTLTVTDDEVQNPAAGTIGFSGPAFAATETGGTATVTLTRTGSQTGAATVTVAVSGGTATAGTDFGTVPTTVTFADGQTTATLQIPVTADGTAEGPETIVLTLSAPTGGAQLSAQSTTTVTITDGVTPPGGVTPLPPSRNLAVGGTLNGQVQLFTPATGTGTGTGTTLYNPTAAATIGVFGTTTVEVRTAVGDVNGDDIEDTILITGPGTAVRVAVVSGVDNTTLLVAPFDPFGGDFTGGGFVAAGDFDPTRLGDEFVVSPDQGGGPRVVIFGYVPSVGTGTGTGTGTGATGTTGTALQLASFFGIQDPGFRGGARVAAGDVDRDGIADLVVAAGFAGGPRVAVFGGTTLFTTQSKLVGDFFAFEDVLRNGVYVAVGDVDGDGSGDLIFGAGPGGSPRVLAISGAVLVPPAGTAAVGGGGAVAAIGAPLANFFVANNSSDRGGVRVAAKDADGDSRAEVVVGSGEGTPGRVRVYRGATFVGTGEPTGFQDLDAVTGATLRDGIFVG